MFLSPICVQQETEITLRFNFLRSLLVRGRNNRQEHMDSIFMCSVIENITVRYFVPLRIFFSRV